MPSLGPFTERSEMNKLSSPSSAALLRRGALPVLATALVASATLFAGAGPSAAATAPAANPSSPTTPASAEKSILLVGTTWSGDVLYPTNDGTWEWSGTVTAQTLCTGWFASTSGHIVTAGHCVDPQEGRESILTEFLAENDALEMLPQAKIDWKTDGGGEGKPLGRTVEVIQPKAVEGAVITDATVAQVLNFEPFENGDLALLRVADLPQPTVPLGTAASTPEIGANITSVGFPASVSQVVDGSRIRASFKTGTVSSNQVGPNGVPGTEINADISPGMSGGPTVDAQGRVVGINSFTISGESKNFNFITNSGDLQTFLKSNNVEVSVPQPSAEAVAVTTTNAAPATSTTGTTYDITWLVLPVLIGGAALLVVLVAGLVLILVLRRRRAAARAATAAAATPSPGTPAASFGPNAPFAPAASFGPGAPFESGAPGAGPAEAIPAAVPVADAAPASFCLDPGHTHPADGKFCTDCGRPIPSNVVS
jgi:serine protease Do